MIPATSALQTTLSALACARGRSLESSWVAGPATQDPQPKRGEVTAEVTVLTWPRSLLTESGSPGCPLHGIAQVRVAASTSANFERQGAPEPDAADHDVRRGDLPAGFDLENGAAHVFRVRHASLRGKEAARGRKVPCAEAGGGGAAHHRARRYDQIPG